MTPSRPAPSKRESHSAATIAIARHRRQMDRRVDAARAALRARARRSPCGTVRGRPAAGGQQIEGDELRRRSPSRAWRRATRPDAAAAASASKSRPRGVAITISPSTTQPAGSRVEKRVVQLGKVAIERPQIAALDEHVGSAAKHDRAKPVPLRLVQERPALGKLLGELREHRLDGRRRSAQVRDTDRSTSIA